MVVLLRLVIMTVPAVVPMAADSGMVAMAPQDMVLMAHLMAVWIHRRSDQAEDPLDPIRSSASGAPGHSRRTLGAYAFHARSHAVTNAVAIL